MDIPGLFQLMKELNLTYFTGMNTKNLIEFDFSKGYNGRGTSVNITCHHIDYEENIDVLIYHEEKSFKAENINYKDTVKFIKQHLNG